MKPCLAWGFSLRNTTRGVVRAKFGILGAAIQPLRSTRKNPGKSMAVEFGSDVLKK
jgi:hypothetical protein